MNPPASKRLKLESSPTPPLDVQRPSSSKSPEEDHCSICLQPVVDRTVVPICSHEFCFECLLVWSEQSRRCPLCSQPIGNHLIHHIRSKYDYQKHYLTPLRTSPRPHQPRNSSNGGRPGRQWGRRERQEMEEADRLDRAIARRRWIYQHDLYAKHVASNAFTRYRPCPTPAQFTASPELISRMTTFLRRELRVWVNMDVEFLTTFILSLLKSIDIRSESAVKLLAEFLDMDNEYVEGRRYVNAEHFAHEVYCYLRSPYRDLFVYDTIAQYDVPPDLGAPPEHEYSRHWRPLSHSNSRSRSRSPHRRARTGRRSNGSRRSSRSLSWSPSGRRWERERGQERERSVGHERNSGRDREESGYMTQRKRAVDSDRRLKEPTPSIREDDGCDTKDDGETEDVDGDGKRHEPGHWPELEKAEQQQDKEKIDAKGKRRAHEFIDNVDGEDFNPRNVLSAHDPIPASAPVSIPKPELPISDIIGEGDTRDGNSVAHLHPGAPDRKKLRASRNRNLLETVQAHLAPHANSGKSRKQIHQEHVDVNPTADSVTRPCREPEPIIEGLDRTCRPSNADGTQQADNDQTSVKARMSAPEIMARTRARLTKLKTEVSPKEVTENPVDIATTLVNSSRASSDAHIGGLQLPSLSKSSSESKDVRAKLMDRLEDEKRQLLSPALVSPDETFHEGVPESTADASALAHSHATEAKLRLRAQLRVRLAAAKRHVQ